MVSDRFGLRVQGRHCACSLAAFCLLVGSFAGCARKDGVTVKVTVADVSDSGVISLWIQIEHDAGAYRVSEFLKKGATVTPLGESSGVGGGGVGAYGNEFHTANRSSVRFLMKEGESVFVPLGAQKDLLEFAPDGEPDATARYTIEVRKAVTEREMIIDGSGKTIWTRER